MEEKRVISWKAIQPQLKNVPKWNTAAPQLACVHIGEQHIYVSAPAFRDWMKVASRATVIIRSFKRMVEFQLDTKECVGLVLQSGTLTAFLYPQDLAGAIRFVRKWPKVLEVYL